MSMREITQGEKCDVIIFPRRLYGDGLRAHFERIEQPTILLIRPTECFWLWIQPLLPLLKSNLVCIVELSG